MDKHPYLSLKYWGKISLFALIYFGCAHLGTERATAFTPLAHHKGFQLKLEVEKNMPATVTADPEGLKKVM